jgi:hypothetical protein
MKLKTIAMTGVMSLAGLGLIGAGAHAVFTTSSASSQQINAGVPGVALWANGATNGCTTEAIAAANAVTCNSITLPAATVGSTFDLPSAVGIVNTGTIPVTLTSLLVTDSANNATLQSGLGFCVTGLGMSYNAALTAFPGFNSAPDAFSGGATLAVAGTGVYQVDFYAGIASSVCGGSPNAPLANGAAGGSDTVTLTVGYTG